MTLLSASWNETVLTGYPAVISCYYYVIVVDWYSLKRDRGEQELPVARHLWRSLERVTVVVTLKITRKVIIEGIYVQIIGSP